MMDIREATDDASIAACYPVMAELRAHLAAEEFVERVRAQMQDGYRLAFVHDGGVRAVAGFRYGRNLAWGRFLYVEDLVAAKAAQGTGYGSRLIEWIIAQARLAGCNQVHLDSGVQRFAAHGFYLKHRFAITSHHFTLVLQNH